MCKKTLQVYCWNIQTNSKKTMVDQGHAQQIANAFRDSQRNTHGFKVDSPWVLAILENKSGGDEVGHALQTKLGGKWFRVVDLGGSNHARENIVLIGGGGCEVHDEPKAFTGWQGSFGAVQNGAKDANVIAAHNAPQNSPYSLRETSFAKRLATAQNQEIKLPEDCRNPAIVKVRAGNEFFKLGFLHAPGPSQKCHPDVRIPDTRQPKPLAMLYAETVMAAINHENLDALLGDFNLYEPGPKPQRMTRIGEGQEPTTCYKDTGEGVNEGGSLDRAFAKQESCAEKDITERPILRRVENFGGGLTDHIGVGVLLGRPGVAHSGNMADSVGANPMQVSSLSLASATSSGDASFMSDD